MEIDMDTKPDRGTIAEEAVGQWLGSAPPDAVREKVEMSPDEAAQRLAKSSGAQASTPEKTAESVGERDSSAYSDASSPMKRQWGNGGRRATLQTASSANRVASSDQFDLQPLITVAAGFALGYMTAVWMHARR
jgi:hypothetical protein